jgi:hypothetical protein
MFAVGSKVAIVLCEGAYQYQVDCFQGICKTVNFASNSGDDNTVS